MAKTETTPKKPKGPSPFEQVIKDHLDRVASEDPQFAEKYNAGLAGKKDIAACCRFITSEVRKTGRQGFTDDEIYGMAMHFYDEESIKAPDNAPQATVVVNREIQLSAEEVKQIREKARLEAEEKVRREELARIEAERKKAEERARKAAERAKQKEEARRAAEAARKEAQKKEQKRLEEEDLLFRFDIEED